MRSTDQHGIPMSGSAEAIALYDDAIDAYLRFNPRVVEIAGQLISEHADAPMAHALVAYLYLSSTDAPDVETARASLAAMAALPLNDREAAHRDALSKWAEGDWIGAGRALDALLVQWPGDVLALQMGHALDFFVGDAANLRDRPGRTRLAIDPTHPHLGFVRGMQAFGLEESGDYGAAHENGMAALAVNPDDVWAVHAVVHVYEMQGRIDEGIRFLTERRADWGAGNLFTVHNWWHLALYLLEAGEIDAALAIYDREVHNPESQNVPLEMLDASALLWRLYLDGADTGGRFSPLADAWAAKLDPQSWYVFNDVHATMALVGAGRIVEAEQHVADLAGYVHRNGNGTNIAMTHEIGLPAARAVIRYAQGRHDDVVAELLPIRRVFQHFGGSHAQRDALQRTLLMSALASGRNDLAAALTSERLSVRETSVYGWTQRAHLLHKLGRSMEAATAEANAVDNRNRFATAWKTAAVQN
jgi:tetratricopeptide (TPR) repeat protein